METKDLIALALFLFALVGCIGACCCAQWVRDAVFVLMVSGTAITGKLDVDFFSYYWYRGTTRGLEFTVIDVLAIGLLVGTGLAGRREQRQWHWPASLGFMLVYVGYCAFSVATAEPKIYGLFELSKMIRGLIFFLSAFVFVKSARELSLLAVALGGAICFEGALVLKQRYLNGVHRVTGTLDHPNSLSMYLCLAGPVLVAAATSPLAKWVRHFAAACIPVATVAIVLTISRAGIPIFALGMLGAAAYCISWRLTPRRLAAVGLFGLAVAGLGFKSWERLKVRFEESPLAREYTDEGVESRGYFLRQAQVIIADRFLGVGLNNWSYWVSKQYGAEVNFAYEDYDDIEYAPSKEILPSIAYAAPAHNLGALTVGELGWIGLALFSLAWLRWLQMAVSVLWRRGPATLRYFGSAFFFSISSVLLQSLFEWVYRQTQIFLAFHLLLGALASLYAVRRQFQARPKFVPDGRLAAPALAAPLGQP